MGTLRIPVRASIAHGISPGKRVLVIEHETTDRERFCSILRQHGFLVNDCESPAQGEELLANEDFDFVLVDQGSHAFEGRAVLERVLQLNRHLPTVVLTRCVDMKCYLEAMQMGAIDYLEKPVSDNDILKVVENHIQPRHLVA